jgi:hypothetical protein
VILQERELASVLDRLAVVDSDAAILDVDTGVLNVETPLHRQIVDSFVQDSAIDDAIYVLVCI